MLTTPIAPISIQIPLVFTSATVTYKVTYSIAPTPTSSPAASL